MSTASIFSGRTASVPDGAGSISAHIDASALTLAVLGTLAAVGAADVELSWTRSHRAPKSGNNSERARTASEAAPKGRRLGGLRVIAEFSGPSLARQVYKALLCDRSHLYALDWVVTQSL